MPGRRRDLEMEAVDADPSATLQAALAFGADDEGRLHQRDTYFHAVQGRLKLREAPPEPADSSPTRAPSSRARRSASGRRQILRHRRHDGLRAAGFDPPARAG